MVLSAYNKYFWFTIIACAGPLLGPTARADICSWEAVDVSEEMLGDIAKYYFYINSSDAYNKRWGDLQTIVVPEKTIEGRVSGYYGITYFGEGDAPTLEEMLEWSRRSYETRKKAIASGIDVGSAIFSDEVSETDKEILRAWGTDPTTNKLVFHFSFFRVSPKGFWFEHGGSGIPDFIADSYGAKKDLEGRYGIDGLEFEGPIITCEDCLVEFTGGGRRYFAHPLPLYRNKKMYSDVDIPRLTEGGFELKDHAANGKTWETFLEELGAYKE